MKNLKAKLRRDGGFTLVEMLIVVAIIAILIAVSIPTIGTALEEAKEATDKSNERSFKAELTIAFLGGAKVGTEDFKANTLYKYNAADGSLVAADGAVKFYGQSKNVDKMALLGSIDENGNVKMGWGTGNTATVAPLGDFVTSSVGG